MVARVYFLFLKIYKIKQDQYHTRTIFNSSSIGRRCFFAWLCIHLLFIEKKGISLKQI